MNELITVIVPVYKVEKYLDRCIESIINQTYKNLEIILVDDGSPDSCPHICDAWAEKDSRIKVIHKPNTGVFDSRYEALKIMSGSYVTFIDSDDWADNDLVEYLLSLIKKYNAQISCAQFVDVNKGEEDKFVKPEFDEKIELLDFEETVKRAIGYNWGKLYDAKLFNDLPVMPNDISVLEDTMLNFFLFKNCKQLVLSNQIKYYYFRHPSSVTSGCISDKMIDDSLRALDFILLHNNENSTVYEYLVKNRVCQDFFLLNSVINNWKCLDRFKDIRHDIVKYKQVVFKKHIFTLFKPQYKIGVVLTIYFPLLYVLLIRIRKLIRGY